MKVYMVFKEGVYRHECGGAFSTLELAVAAAESLIAGEKDDYHKYGVTAFDLDARSRQGPLVEGRCSDGSPYFSGGEIDEPPLLVDISRKDNVTMRLDHPFP